MSYVFLQGERETVCVFDETNDVWVVESSVRKHITKLLKMYGEENISNSLTDDNGRYIYVEFKNVDPSQVSFRSKSKPRVMTEEQKQQLADRLRKSRENQF